MTLETIGGNKINVKDITLPEVYRMRDQRWGNFLGLSSKKAVKLIMDESYEWEKTAQEQGIWQTFCGNAAAARVLAQIDLVPEKDSHDIFKRVATNQQVIVEDIKDLIDRDVPEVAIQLTASLRGVSQDLVSQLLTADKLREGCLDFIRLSDERGVPNGGGGLAWASEVAVSYEVVFGDGLGGRELFKHGKGRLDEYQISLNDKYLQEEKYLQFFANLKLLFPNVYGASKIDDEIFSELKSHLNGADRSPTNFAEYVLNLVVAEDNNPQLGINGVKVHAPFLTLEHHEPLPERRRF